MGEPDVASHDPEDRADTEPTSGVTVCPCCGGAGRWNQEAETYTCRTCATEWFLDGSYTPSIFTLVEHPDGSGRYL